LTFSNFPYIFLAYLFMGVGRVLWMRTRVPERLREIQNEVIAQHI
jgi:hypothetical protein